LLAGIERHDIGDHILLSGPRALLARRLAELLPGDLQYSFFGTSATEAKEHALELARSDRASEHRVHAGWFLRRELLADAGRR
jgi:acetylornithine/succinyldiaminopimelate/putrescine aminotransferase